MRLRIGHKLGALIAGLLLFSAAAISGVTLYDLRRGFADYLAARQHADLQLFADRLAREIRSAGGTARLAADPNTVPRLLNENIGPALARAAGPPPPRGQMPPAQGFSRQDFPGQGFPGQPGTGRFPSPPPLGLPQGAPPGGPPGGPLGGPPGGPPGGGPSGGDQDMAGLLPGMPVAVLGNDGKPWAGLTLPPGLAVQEVPVMVDGKTLAYARMPLAPPVPDGIAANFLRRQTRNVTLITLALSLAGLLAALIAARFAVRPLVAMEQATARIAAGDFSVRLPAQGQDELAEAQGHINAMAESLGRLEAARRTWLAQIAHELRTPLAAMRGEIEAMTDGVRPLTAAGLASLHEEILQLGRLLDDLHLVAIADLQALTCVFAECDVADLAARAIARQSARAGAIALELAAPDPLFAIADQGRLAQLLDNLLQNSLRYTDAPGRVRLTLRRQEETAEIMIDDTPPAVAAADLDKLFDPLFRAEASRARAHGGSGLGLTVCRAIVTAHGGRIWAEASPLGGLRVIVHLPCVPPAAWRDRAAPAALRQEGGRA